MKMKKYNIALVFNQEVETQIIGYAKKLYNHIPSKLSLGQNSLPHMTLIQFTAEESVKKTVWADFRGLALETPILTLSGVTILPSSGGGAWIEISVLKSDELLKLQQSIISCLPSIITPDNDTGDKYRPHITIAHLSESRETIAVPVEYKPLRLNNLESKLAIGVGTNFDPCIEVL